MWLSSVVLLILISISARPYFCRDPNLTRIKNCQSNKDCFHLTIPSNYTMLQAYNCDRQKPGEKKEKMPAEKQLYRPDYVLHHFIHYSTVTKNSVLNKEDTEKLGRRWNSHSPFPDPKSRFGNENTEALMLHTKAVAYQDTVCIYICVWVIGNIMSVKYALNNLCSCNIGILGRSVLSVVPRKSFLSSRDTVPRRGLD